MTMAKRFVMSLRKVINKNVTLMNMEKRSVKKVKENKVKVKII